jgi:hypothetical protein
MATTYDEQGALVALSHEGYYLPIHLVALNNFRLDHKLGEMQRQSRNVRDTQRPAVFSLVGQASLRIDKPQP